MLHLYDSNRLELSASAFCTVDGKTLLQEAHARTLAALRFLVSSENASQYLSMGRSEDTCYKWGMFALDAFMEIHGYDKEYFGFPIEAAASIMGTETSNLFKDLYSELSHIEKTKKSLLEVHPLPETSSRSLHILACAEKIIKDTILEANEALNYHEYNELRE